VSHVILKINKGKNTPPLKMTLTLSNRSKNLNRCSVFGALNPKIVKHMHKWPLHLTVFLHYHIILDKVLYKTQFLSLSIYNN